MGVKVVEIKPDPKHRSRQIVTLEDGSRFSLDDNLLVKHGLRLGVEVDGEAIREIAREDEIHRAKRYAFDLLVCRDYTARRMTKKLADKGFSIEAINITIDTLKKMGYIRDERYARNWVSSRLRNNPRGRSLLKAELLRRGVDKATVDRVLDEIDESAEYQAALKAARKQMRTHYAKLNKVVARRRLYGFLTRRGFELELVKKVIDEVLEEKEG
jgi:regulatory protein